MNAAPDITPPELKTIMATERFINVKSKLSAFQASSAAADAPTNRRENLLIKSF
jgi:hypothetical protein